MNQTHILKQRADTINSIKKVVRAKKLIAASLWQNLAKQTKHLHLCCAYLQKSLKFKIAVTSFSRIPPILLQSQSPGKSAGIIFGIDDIMCGGFGNSLSHIAQHMPHDILYVFGDKTAQSFPQADHRGNLSCSFDQMYSFAIELLEQISQSKITSLDVLSLTNHKFSWAPLLPLLQPQLASTKELDDEDSDLTQAPALLLALRLYEKCIVVRAQENFERITATDQSVKNCDELLAELKLQQNKMRQAAITQELAEILAGL